MQRQEIDDTRLLLGTFGERKGRQEQCEAGSVDDNGVLHRRLSDQEDALLLYPILVSLNRSRTLQLGLQQKQFLATILPLSTIA